jgi:hypothetical protein
MGLISGLRGNASQTNTAKIEKDFSQLLIEGEEIHRVFKYIRNYFVLTNKRIVLVEKMDLAGKKTNYHSVAYNKILHFSVETSGHLELDHELKLWCAGWPEPITWTFNRGFDVFELQVAVASRAL